QHRASEEQGLGKYAFATALSMNDHMPGALVLCYSLRRGISKWPEDIEIAAIITNQTSTSPPPDKNTLLKCFDVVYRYEPFLTIGTNEPSCKAIGSLDAMHVLGMT